MRKGLRQKLKTIWRILIKENRAKPDALACDLSFCVERSGSAEFPSVILRVAKRKRRIYVFGRCRDVPSPLEGEDGSQTTEGRRGEGSSRETFNCISSEIKKAIYLYIRCMAFFMRDKTAKTKALSVSGLPRATKSPRNDDQDHNLRQRQMENDNDIN
jgi:hypothetical protein